MPVGLALVPLIQRRRAGSDQAGADDGMEQREEMDSLQEFKPA